MIGLGGAKVVRAGAWRDTPVRKWRVFRGEQSIVIEAVTFSIEHGALVFWSATQRAEAIAPGHWSGVELTDD